MAARTRLSLAPTEGYSRSRSYAGAPNSWSVSIFGHCRRSPAESMSPPCPSAPRTTGRATPSTPCCIAEHLEAFLETAKRHADGSSLPEFVEQEFRDFLTCGVLAHGFARLRCADCAVERLVPFSCKGRGFCPSCGGRRMTERAARIVDEVLPRVPVRQWVLSLPYRLRYLLAWDHALARAVLGVFVRVLLGFQRHRARRYGIRDGRSGCVTVIQRFGGGLNLNIHFHTLLFDGVFCAKGEEGMLDFRPLPPPTDEEVGVVLARITARLQRLLERRGLESGGADLCQADPVVEESPALAGISSASIQGRIALGPCAGARMWRVGDDPDAPWVLSTAPRHAYLAGLRSPRQRRGAGSRSHSAGATVPLSAPSGGGPGSAPAPGRWPHRAHAQDRVGGRHAPARVRAPGAAREARRAHPTAAYQPRALPRRACAARGSDIVHPFVKCLESRGCVNRRCDSLSEACVPPRPSRLCE